MSRDPSEVPISLGQPLLVGAIPGSLRNPEELATVHILDPVAKHWTVDLNQHFFIDVHNVVGSNSQDVGVKGRVMNLAQSESVWHYRLPTLVLVAQDMRGIEKCWQLELADGAMVLVCQSDLRTKPGLMHSSLDQGLSVPSLNL